MEYVIFIKNDFSLEYKEIFSYSDIHGASDNLMGRNDELSDIYKGTILHEVQFSAIDSAVAGVRQTTARRETHSHTRSFTHRNASSTTTLQSVPIKQK